MTTDELMNGYNITIVGSNYQIDLQAMGEDKDDALNSALYTLINSEPKIDLFDQELQYEAEFVERIEN